MKLKKIPETTHVLDLVAMPVFLEGKRNEGILMLHGFTGTPCELYQLGETLNHQGFTVSIPRLPGHGTNVNDFLQTGWKDWLRRALDSYFELKYKCETVNVIGLSMGSLIGIILASKFNIPKLALIVPALKVSDWRLKLTPLFSFLGYIKLSKTPKYEYEGLNKIAEQYWNKLWIKPAANFYKIQRLAKKELKNVKSEVLAIFSKKDGTVPFSAKKILEDNLPEEKVRFLVLEKSSHVVTTDLEKEKVFKSIIEFFR